MKSLSKNRGAIIASIVLSTALAFQAQTTFAQVKIGNNPDNINKGSVLEIEHTSKGLLLPRIPLDNTLSWQLDGSDAVPGMQVYNINPAMFTESVDYPVIPGGLGVYTWDGNGWVGAKYTPPSGGGNAGLDFDWLKTSNDENPSAPGDISTSIYHGGAGNQDITARTTELSNGRFARFTARTGHGQTNPIVTNFFAENNVQAGRTAGLQVTSTDPLVFRTTNAQNLAPTERMRITNGGLIGIGTSTPGAQLHVKGAQGIFQSDGETLNSSNTGTILGEGRIQAFNRNGSADIIVSTTPEGPTKGTIRYTNQNQFQFVVGNEGSQQGIPVSFNAMTILGTNGFVGVNNTHPVFQFDVTGSGRFTGLVIGAAFQPTSDKRLKTNIQPVTDGLKTVAQLNPVSYMKKAKISDNKYDQAEIGFIAQEVQKILPELVHEAKDADKTLSLNYTALIPVLTKAIQEQQKQIESLKSENQQLTGKVASFEQSAQIVSTLSAELNEIKRVLNLIKEDTTTEASK